jgi:hypothetical protein
MANSLSTDWDKFYEIVMGENAPKAETPVRVTPEGLNVYQRPVVAIDSAGNPIYDQPAGPPQGTKNARGSMPSADNSLAEPWGGTIDQIKLPRRDIVQNIPAPVMTAAQTVDAADPINVNNWGLTRDSFFAKDQNPAEKAILDVLVRDGNQQGPWKGWGGSSPAVAAGQATARRSWADSWLGRQGGSPMIAGTPRLVPGDPWSGLRVGGGNGTPRPGLATGTLMRAGTPAPSAPVMVAAQPGYNGTNNVTSSELRPVHQSIFSDNAMLPSGMNTKRWVGDGY